MELFEFWPYSYRGFYEGEYMHRYFLTAKQATGISTRDLLSVYDRLRGITPNLLPDQIKPSNFRKKATMDVVNMAAGSIANTPIKIHYRYDGLTKEFNTEQTDIMVKACHAYATACADCDLDDDDWSGLYKLFNMIIEEQSALKEELKQICRTLETGSINYHIAVQRMYFTYTESETDNYTVAPLEQLYYDQPIYYTGQDIIIDDLKEWEKQIDNYFRSCKFSRAIEGIDVPADLSGNYEFMSLLESSPIPLKHLKNIQQVYYDISLSLGPPFSVKSIVTK